MGTPFYRGGFPKGGRASDAELDYWRRVEHLLHQAKSDLGDGLVALRKATEMIKENPYTYVPPGIVDLAPDVVQENFRPPMKKMPNSTRQAMGTGLPRIYKPTVSKAPSEAANDLISLMAFAGLLDSYSDKGYGFSRDQMRAIIGAYEGDDGIRWAIGNQVYTRHYDHYRWEIPDLNSPMTKKGPQRKISLYKITPVPATHHLTYHAAGPWIDPTVVPTEKGRLFFGCPIRYLGDIEKGAYTEAQKKHPNYTKPQDQ